MVRQRPFALVTAALDLFLDPSPARSGCSEPKACDSPGRHASSRPDPYATDQAAEALFAKNCRMIARQKGEGSP
jgi:hypothetical protein